MNQERGGVSLNGRSVTGATVSPAEKAFQKRAIAFIELIFTRPADLSFVAWPVGDALFLPPGSTSYPARRGPLAARLQRARSCGLVSMCGVSAIQMPLNRSATLGKNRRQRRSRGIKACQSVQLQGVVDGSPTRSVVEDAPYLRRRCSPMHSCRERRHGTHLVP